MKKYVSVFGLIAASSFYRALCVLLITCAAQLTAHYLLLQDNLSTYLERLAQGKTWSPPLMTDSSPFIAIPFGIGLILITLLLLRFGRETQSKPSYTLNRLSVSARALFLIQTVYHVIIYFLFWMAEIATLFSMGLMYTNMMPSELVGEQTVFLAFYTDYFLHGTLPLEDSVLWVRNVVVFLCLAICTADPKRSATPRTPLVLSVAAALFWQNGLVSVSMPILMITVALIFAIYTIESAIGLTKERRSEDEKENEIYPA